MPPEAYMSVVEYACFIFLLGKVSDSVAAPDEPQKRTRRNNAVPHFPSKYTQASDDIPNVLQNINLRSLAKHKWHYHSAPTHGTHWVEFERRSKGAARAQNKTFLLFFLRVIFVNLGKYTKFPQMCGVLDVFDTSFFGYILVSLPAHTLGMLWYTCCRSF